MVAMDFLVVARVFCVVGYEVTKAMSLASVYGVVVRRGC